MIKCDCYCVEEQIIGWHTPVDPKTTIVHKCNGTKERDECSCGGDRTKCDFYPEVRQKALQEQEPKFGEWISVKDRLPEESGWYLVVLNNYNTDLCRYSKLLSSFGMQHHNGWVGCDDEVTHWMPLPTPPTE